MSWFTSARASLLSLGDDSHASFAQGMRDTAAGVEPVRQAMLDLMACAGPVDQHLDLLIRINYASSLQTLWYARSDVMLALADARGEAFARRQLEDVTRLFVGLLPEARPHAAKGRRR